MLALGNNTNYFSPKQVGALTNWASVAAGSIAAAFGIKTDGTLWAWGKPSYYGPFGQLGLGNNTAYSSPIQVGALTNWLKIANSYDHALAIKTDGTLWTWGYNGNGQLGLNNRTYYSSPKQVGALTNWSNTATGAQTSFGIRTDGTLWAWGTPGGYSRLGLNNNTNYSSPKQVGALTNWSVLNTFSNGGQCCFAIKTDGTLWGWGPQNVGQLGLGNTTYYSSPKQVGSLTTWRSVSTWLNGTGALQY
jgi:alpha-tubulin suppressor-like RCC1 family protein